MANSMFESILSMVTPEMKQSVASRLGDSPQSAQSGLTTATAVTLAGLANNSGDSGFMDQVMHVVSRASSQNLPASLGSIASGGPGGASSELVERFQSLVFGNQQGRVENLISQRSGVSTASAAGLLKMAAPLVLGYLAKLHSSGTLSSSTLGNMLRAETPSLAGHVPTGLFRGTAGTASETVSRVGDRVSETAGRAGERASDGTYRIGERASTGDARYAEYVERRAHPTNRWAWAIPAVIIAALLGWLAWRGTHTGMRASHLAAPSARASLGPFEKLRLPDGTDINVPANGVEVKLVEYIQGNKGSAGQATGLDLDRLRFDTNSATLQPSSYEQLNNIAAILKAYPSVKINLGGYTDNTGDAHKNLQLSQQRADNVVAELTKRGIDPSRLTATGYGQEQAVADNSTEEGRQKNRRISIRVAEK